MKKKKNPYQFEQAYKYDPHTKWGDPPKQSFWTCLKYAWVCGFFHRLRHGPYDTKAKCVICGKNYETYQYPYSI